MSLNYQTCKNQNSKNWKNFVALERQRTEFLSYSGRSVFRWTKDEFFFLPPICFIFKLKNVACFSWHPSVTKPDRIISFCQRWAWKHHLLRASVKWYIKVVHWRYYHWFVPYTLLRDLRIGDIVNSSFKHSYWFVLAFPWHLITWLDSIWGLARFTVYDCVPIMWIPPPTLRSRRCKRQVYVEHYVDIGYLESYTVCSAEPLPLPYVLRVHRRFSHYTHPYHCAEILPSHHYYRFYSINF